MTIHERPKILSYIIPTYDEVTLFAMGFTCCLLLITGAFSTKWKVPFNFSKDDFTILVLITSFLAGLILSIYHAFATRHKNSFEKLLMVYFAVILNGYSGIVAGSYFLEYSQGWRIIFPILNIVNGALLIILLRVRVINADNISDENAAWSQVAITASLIIILFTVCQYKLHLFWTETLSICVAYSTNVNQGVQNLLLRWLPKKSICVLK